MKYDVVALGELLIDFTQSEPSNAGNPQFEANPGGAPCNVLAMLAKLGKNTAFIGKVGNDMFGAGLRKTIEDAGINAEGLVTDNNANTTLAFVQNAENGEREFSFFRKPGADTLLCAEELLHNQITNCQIFHFGSLSLTDDPARTATQIAVSTAAQNGALISFDPNLRPLLWKSLAHAKMQINWGLSQCNLLKISEEEAVFITDEEDLSLAVEKIRNKYPNIQLLLLTKGSQGAEAFYEECHVTAPAYTVNSIDTTGAGDTFCGTCLYYLLEHDITMYSEQNLAKMLSFASAAAALVTTKKGAIRSMPSAEEIAALQNS